MARKESVALGGYFPFPEHLVSRIGSIVEPYVGTGGAMRPSFLDPCAGDGSAILSIMERLGHPQSVLWSCEMELLRATALRDRLKDDWNSSRQVIHGDAFRVSFEQGYSDGVSLLFLNPPYDTDKVHGRLEERFLARFTHALADDGVLLFVVPFYALAASAQTLGRFYTDLHCFRFPDEDFGFKQVILCARKATTILPFANPAVVAQVEAWASDEATLAPWPEQPVVSLPEIHNGGLSQWLRRTVDIKTLKSKVQPWMHNGRHGGALTSVPGVIPDLPVQEILLRTYPVATPPRPAHIAAGIASGLFNGAHIEPDIARTGLPPLLVKGVFDREFRTVEEKHNEEGKVVGVYQVQQPRLVTTILDLSTYRYHILNSGAEETGAVGVADMTVADLLKHYGKSLMAAMEKQCPIFYDPRTDGDSITLSGSPRKLFTAQSHASKALVKLLGGPSASPKARKGKAAILLGEIGSGKSTVALMTAVTCGAKRLLVLCPPHLLDSWTNEITAVLPDADIRVLKDIADVDNVTTLEGDQVVVSILSRETAKLNHGWESVGEICPKCGAENLRVDHAKKRSRCNRSSFGPGDKLARQCVSLAYKLAPHLPFNTVLGHVLHGRHNSIRLAHYRQNTRDTTRAFTDLYGGLNLAPSAWERLLDETGVPLQNPDLEWVDDTLDLLLSKANATGWYVDKKISDAIMALLFAVGDNARIARVAQSLLSEGSHYGRVVVQMLPPGSETQNQILEECRNARFKWDPSDTFDRELTGTAEGVPFGSMHLFWSGGMLCHVDQSKTLIVGATIVAAGEALNRLYSVSEFVYGPPCGEVLFQATDSPRRLALAKYIQSRKAATFDFLVLDEGHEYATETSAQSRSAHRLTGLKLPTLLMTGTIMNGYAASLFANMWALSDTFRNEFARTGKQRFVDRYGYRKIYIQHKDEESNEIIEYGSQSDRVVTTTKGVGFAPGVLPLFLLRHLLRQSVTLHKTDLAIDLPKCTQQMHLISPEKEQAEKYKALEEALTGQIKKDMYSEMSGMLFGQLSEMPSFLDRAVVGNVTDQTAFDVRYPETAGGQLVTRQFTFGSDTILPKELWMLDTLEKELAEGRNCMVFAWHTNLIPRLEALIEDRLKEPVAVLHASKVSTQRRQAWINKEVVKKGVRVMVANPVTIQTGLNNLVHFSTEIWMESPGCNPIVYRQATGRVDRIGAKKETRIHFPVYAGTLQEQLYDLLMRKVAVSVSTDGLDPESALQAAGVGQEDYLAGLSIGKQLWAMLQGKSTETDKTLLDTLDAKNRAALRLMCDSD